MKKWDYEITTTGARRTIIAKSDRAKRRTPEPQEFANNADALAFVKSGVVEGFLFSCRSFVDHEYRNVRYHYFVNVSGQLVISGQDNGPPDPMVEVGDVYPGGPRNGKHFDITDVITGEVARANGCGVMIVGKGRDVSKAKLENWCQGELGDGR
jgi:hypothetical protein